MVVTMDRYKLTRCTPFALKVRRVYFLCNRKLRSYYTKRSAGMRTAAYNADVASDRRRCKNERALEQYDARSKRRSGRNKINKVPKYVRYSELRDLRHGLNSIAFMGEA